MEADSRKIPTHEVTWTKLRDMILFGALAPGQPVTIQGLTAELGAGMTPVREAIRRLTAEGALMPQGNRRVAVPQMTQSVLDQLAWARQAIEPHLAELALPRLTPELIARLREIDGEVNAAIAAGSIPGYLRANHSFHFTLYEAAEAPVLLDFAHSLWLRAGPSLRVVMGRYSSSGLPDLHDEALAAMERGDAAGLSAAISRDLQQGIDHVRLALAEGAF
ncbi:GntR family transcriptional regulator [Pseudogemmobacter faecipullorum]|uniref:GntR family transcriptional regulator n=1 Tax=Pseudogemmobacter faecipullorum TaxID=2755041 RepID=A0ABS8CN35_9RHOB|nr:GntR family transcriptional regulator [Pseudogemmobacter faecipullorum]MCB5410255.1 GntR family transcriptional regulator [Pseudogemmobacter faecipullorum]